MLKSEQNTPQVEQEVEQLIATHPETEIHEGCTPIFEHNQWFVTCGPCGAIWSVIDVEGGQNDLDLEELESGDDSCLENFMASTDKTAEIEGDVTCAKCGAKTDSKTQGHEFENRWFCDKCSKEASVEQPVSEKTAEGLFDQFGIWDKFKQWMKTNSSSQQASTEKTAFEPDANSGIRGSNDGTPEELVEKIGEVFLEQSWNEAIIICADLLRKWHREYSRYWISGSGETAK